MKIFVSLADVSAEEKSFVANVGNRGNTGSTKLAKNKVSLQNRLRDERKAMARKFQKASMDHKKQLEAMDAKLKQLEQSS